MSEPVSVLLVAHQTAANPELIEAVRARAQRGPARFHLVVPCMPHGMHKVVDPVEAGQNQARATLEDALPRLSAAAGVPVTGDIGDPEPLSAVMDAVNLGDYEELIISTHPLGISRWLKLDLISKVRALGLPVTHVTSDQGAPTAVS